MTEREAIVAGFDGGGTSTRALLLRNDGVVLGLGRAGTGNLHDVGEQGLTRALTRAWNDAWRADAKHPSGGSADPRTVDAAFCGMASVVTAADRERVRNIVAAIGCATKDTIGVDHDLRAALAGGLLHAPGIVVIAGTGSSCYGRNAQGASWASGGWGGFLDDRGSAFDLGRGALIAAVRAHDGRGASTSLSEAVWERLQLSEWRQLLALIDERGLSRAEVASLATLVTEAAGAGDAVARELIEAGTDELARAVDAVAKRLVWPDPQVVLSGGLATSRTYWEQAFRRAVRQRLPRARVVHPRLAPVYGAAPLGPRIARVRAPRSGSSSAC